MVALAAPVVVGAVVVGAFEFRARARLRDEIARLERDYGTYVATVRRPHVGEAVPGDLETLVEGALSDVRVRAAVETVERTASPSRRRIPLEPAELDLALADLMPLVAASRATSHRAVAFKIDRFGRTELPVAIRALLGLADAIGRDGSEDAKKRLPDVLGAAYAFALELGYRTGLPAWGTPDPVAEIAAVDAGLERCGEACASVPMREACEVLPVYAADDPRPYFRLAVLESTLRAPLRAEVTDAWRTRPFAPSDLLVLFRETTALGRLTHFRSIERALSAPEFGRIQGLRQVVLREEARDLPFLSAGERDDLVAFMASFGETNRRVVAIRDRLCSRVRRGR